MTLPPPPIPTKQAASGLLSEQELQAIRERTDKATAPPWTSTAYTPDEDVPVDRVLCRGEELAQVWPQGGCVAAFEKSQRDGDFIAHARTDIPALLAHISALARRVEILRRLGHEVEDVGTKEARCWTCKKPMHVPADVDAEGIPTECWRCAADAASRRAGEVVADPKENPR